MSNIELCMWCRHWMAGTLDGCARTRAMLNDQKYTCHVKQPKLTEAYEHCEYFDTIPCGERQ